MARIKQFMNAGLGGGMNLGQISDPTALWRQLSASFAQNPDELAQFLGHPAQHAGGGALHTPGAGGGYMPPPAYGHSPMTPPPAAPPTGQTPGFMHPPAQAPAPGFAHPPMPQQGLHGNPGDALHALSQASPRNQLNALATAQAVARTLQHLRKLRPVEGLASMAPPPGFHLPAGHNYAPQGGHYL